MKLFNVHASSPKRCIVTVKAETKKKALAEVRDLGYGVPNGLWAVKVVVPDIFNTYAQMATRRGAPMGVRPAMGCEVDVHKNKRA